MSDIARKSVQVSFYNNSSTLNIGSTPNGMTLFVKIAPIFDNFKNERSKPKAGENRYDYNNSSVISLSLTDLGTIYEFLKLLLTGKTSESLNIVHQFNGVTSILSIGLTQNGREYISVKKGNISVMYTFNSTKINKDSQVYLKPELGVFFKLIEKTIQANLELQDSNYQSNNNNNDRNNSSNNTGGNNTRGKSNSNQNSSKSNYQQNDDFYEDIDAVL